MRNIFLFVRRYFNFLFFLALQVLALYFLFRYNRFHEAAFMGVASEVTGRINERYNNVDHYFKLRKSNEILARENLYLRERLRGQTDGLWEVVVEKEVVVGLAERDGQMVLRAHIR